MDNIVKHCEKPIREIGRKPRRGIGKELPCAIGINDWA